MTTTTPTNVFADIETTSYPHRYHGTLLVHTLAGGEPKDPNIAKAWIQTKLGDNDDRIRAAIADWLINNGFTGDADQLDQAVSEYADTRHLVGFPRDDQGLFIPGRNLKACLKEAGNIAASADKIKLKWGKGGKYLKGWLTEHVFVLDHKLHLGVTEPTGIAQSFPKSRHGSSIQYTEYVENARIDFTVVTDCQFTHEEWGHLWLTAGNNGLGASRSQGYGRFDVIRWEQAQ